MIQAIGTKKALIIGLMAVLAVGGYFYNTSILEPGIVQNERMVRKVQSDLREMTKNTEKLIEGVDIFNEQREEFVVIQKSGFFDDQNRVIARNRLDAIGLESNLETFRYNISPAEIVTSDKLKEAGYKILSTIIELDLGAIDDTDINKVVYLLAHGFPGQVLIESVTMKKEQNLTQPLLRNIGLSEQYKPLVSSKVRAQWFTMVPVDEQSQETQEGQ